MAFAQIEPFGGPVDDMRAGVGPAVQINSNLKEGAEPVGPHAFFPWYTKGEPVPDTPEVIAARLRSMLNQKAKHGN